MLYIGVCILDKDFSLKSSINFYLHRTFTNC
nr:MAG TPA: hypothetical protein [Caudoviricetes sp.]